MRSVQGIVLVEAASTYPPANRRYYCKCNLSPLRTLSSRDVVIGRSGDGTGAEESLARHAGQAACPRDQRRGEAVRDRSAFGSVQSPVGRRLTVG